MPSDPLVIVLVEDDDGHASLVRRNLERSGINNEVVRLRDGQEALDFLLGRSAESDLHRPILLLLDINMPRVDGIEVLRRVKSDDRTSTIPIIMLTTTDDPREIERCYQYGCAVYVTKPVEYDAFVQAVQRLGLFLQIVQVPREGDHAGGTGHGKR